eukprot:4908932-Alexandrium_andersonii.AAC.1
MDSEQGLVQASKRSPLALQVPPPRDLARLPARTARCTLVEHRCRAFSRATGMRATRRPKP